MVRNAWFLVLMVAALGACGERGTLLPGDDIPLVDLAADPGRDLARDVGLPTDRGGENGPSIDPGPGADDDGPGTDTPVPPGCPERGALVITEVLLDPSKVDDGLGEYFEVYNPGAAPVDLRDLEIRSGDKQKTLIVWPEALLVQPGEVRVLAKSADSALNGGIEGAWAYPSLTFTNSTPDSVSIWCGDRLIDEVAWDKAAGWPVGKAGRALALDPSAFDEAGNDQANRWCFGWEAYGAGDFGSPGRVNPPCGANSCGDKLVQAWEVCDDANDTAGDGCESDCTATPEGCGDGKVQAGEDCDDGNRLPGDGCGATCLDESFAAGAVVITEFLYDPKGAAGTPVDDTVGEWIELYNPGAAPVDIAGWSIAKDDTAGHRILPEAGTLVIPAGGWVVLGRNADPLVNGGVEVDYAGGVSLTNTAGRIVLRWAGNVIDELAYGAAAGFPTATGRSIQLSPGKLDHVSNDAGVNWCAAPDSATMTGGDFGTPGAANPPCP